MLAIIQAWFYIALRRLGPEDLPQSGLLLLVSGVAYLLLQMVVALPFYGVSPQLGLVVGADLLLLTLFAWLLLRFVGRPERLMQTLSALFGTGALLTLFVLPFNYWWDATATSETGPLLPAMAILFIIVWSLIVNGHILARALSAPFRLGVLIALGYFFINYLVLLQVRSPLS